jgi:MFS family permease
MSVELDPAHLREHGSELATPPRVSYAAVLALPGVARVFLPAVVGRLAFAMVMLAVLLMVQGSAGVFALAGATTGALGITNVLASPLRARLVDRLGQRAVLPALAVLYSTGLVTLVLVVLEQAPAWVVVMTAAVSGLFPPPLGAAMRVIWASITPEGGLRLRAFSLDSVSEDVAFTLGPLLVSGFLIWASPAAAVLTAAAAITVSTSVLTSSRLSRAQSGRRHPRPGKPSTDQATASLSAAGGRTGLFRRPQFGAMLLVLAGLGVLLGAAEMATAAFAEHTAGSTLTGALLAAFAGGSCLGGLLYGTRDWHASTGARLLGLSAAVVLTCGALALAGHAVVFGVLVALIGFSLGPALVTGYLLADETSTPQNRTESSAWVSTAVNAGASLATVLVGALVDHSGTTVALGASVGIAAICVLLAAAPLARRRAAATLLT